MLLFLLYNSVVPCQRYFLRKVLLTGASFVSACGNLVIVFQEEIERDRKFSLELQSNDCVTSFSL